MAGFDNIPLDVKEGEDFVAQADTIDLERKALDAKLEGLLFIVARTPEEFPAVDDGVWMARYTGEPQMNIYYTFDSQCVTLLGIELAPDDANQ